MDIKVHVNGREVAVPSGAKIMEAIQKLGLYVPHFCYHEKLSIAANCRMCMVEVQKASKPVPACATPAADGMVVHTDSELAKKAQHGVMEFLLINHPLDCPICDQGGECQLQDLAVGYGISRSRYQEEKRVVFEKNLGPLISTDMTRCIHCTRCVRFGTEVAGVMELGMAGRGEHAEIMPFVERTVDSEISGNIIDLCPVGALTSKPFRYSARAWELRRHQSIGTHDSWNSHLEVQTKDELVKRVLPSRAPDIREHWISDRDRFSYEGLAAADRATAPMAREPGGKTLKELPWKEAIALTAQRLRETAAKHGAEQIGFFVSPRATCEEALLAKRIADALGCKNIDSRLRQRHFDGAELSGFGIALAELKSVKNILFIGAEPARELPLLAAHLRQHSKKKKIFSIAAQDNGQDIPLAAQVLTAPPMLSALLESLLVAAGAGLPAGYQPSGRSSDLFANAEDNTQTLRQIAEQLKNGETLLWLGDSAQSAADYGVIAALAQHLAAHLGARIGTLADGGNGAGVRRAGALPPPDGKHTAAMLRSGLKAVLLLRCEKADFAEAALAEKMLHEAEFVCALSSFGGGQIAASTLLAAAEFSESEGTYINGDGQVSQVQAAAPPPGKARPAWKILRLLGEYLKAPGFDFADLAPVRGWLAEQDAAAISAARPLQQVEAGKSGFCLHGGAPLYGGDMLVRRAPALQKTRQGKAAQCAAMHPQDMAENGLAEGGRICIQDAAGNEEEATLIGEERLARGVLRFQPKALADADGLQVHAVAEEKTA